MNQKFLSFPPISPNLEISKKAKCDIAPKPKKICHTPKESRKNIKADIVIKITSPIRNKDQIETKSANITPIMPDNNSNKNVGCYSSSKTCHISPLSHGNIQLENNISPSCKHIPNNLNSKSSHNRFTDQFYNNNKSNSITEEEKVLFKKDMHKVSSKKHTLESDNQNLMRSNRLNGNFYQHQFGNIFNSLSSPESAYSTGYSTDGTSPGKELINYIVTHNIFYYAVRTIQSLGFFCCFELDQSMHLILHSNCLDTGWNGRSVGL